MADEHTTVSFLALEPVFEAASRHSALVAGFRAKLAGQKSPLDSIPAEQLDQARREFRELPEVAGEPLPIPSAKASSANKCVGTPTKMPVQTKA